jgi:hypothetical protein
MAASRTKAFDKENPLARAKGLAEEMKLMRKRQLTPMARAYQAALLP